MKNLPYFELLFLRPSLGSRLHRLRNCFGLPAQVLLTICICGWGWTAWGQSKFSDSTNTPWLLDNEMLLPDAVPVNALNGSGAWPLSATWVTVGMGVLLLLLLLLLLFQRRQILIHLRTNKNISALLGLTKLDYFIIDQKGCFVMPPRNEHNWGVNSDGIPLSAKEWIAPEDYPKFQYQLQRLFCGRAHSVSLMYHIETANGKRYFSYKAMPANSELHGIPLFFGTIHDITALRKREQQYNDTMRLLQSIMDHLPCPIFTKLPDKEFQYQTVNRAFGRLFHKTPEDLSGKNDFDLFTHLPDAQAIRAHDLSVVDSGKAPVTFSESFQSSANAPRRQFQVLKQRLTQANHQPLLLGICIDVTEIENARNELARTNTILQTILNNAPCSIWARDLNHANGDFLLTNFAQHPLCAELNSPVETASQPEREAALKMAVWMKEDDFSAAAMPGKVFTVDRVLHVGDEEKHLHISRTVIPQAEHGRLLVGMAVDVTQLMKMQQQLELALKQAQEANRVKSYFFASVSHELRTPLNAVIGFSEMLQLSELSIEEQQEALQAINYAGNTLLELINDILDLSKLDAQCMQFHITTIALGKLFQNVLKSFQPRCKQNSIQLSLDIAGDVPPFVKLDALRLKQILFNLVGNAIKYAANGTVTVSLRFLRTPGMASSGALVFDVQDSGQGIPQEEQEKIFEPFMQSGAPSIPGCSRSNTGTGLGLPIARRMARNMNGDITLNSTPGKGCCFRVMLHQVEIVSSEVARQIPELQDNSSSPVVLSQLGQYQNARILIVDDIPLNLRVLETMLKKLKVGSVISCSSGQEVLQTLTSSDAVDLLLVDMWMPEMSGQELAQQLHERWGEATPPVIALTADIQIHSDQLFQGVLLKPLTLQKLDDVLKTFLPNA